MYEKYEKESSPSPVLSFFFPNQSRRFSTVFSFYLQNKPKRFPFQTRKALPFPAVPNGLAACESLQVAASTRKTDCSIIFTIL